MLPVILITLSIVIVFSLIILFSSLESNNDFNEYNSTIETEISKKKMEIQSIENYIDQLNNIISANEKYIKILEKLYPEGSHYILNPLIPQHFNKVELCGDKQVDDKYLEVLSQQNKLEDIMYKQNHIIKVYNKYRDNRKFTYDTFVQQ